MGQADQLIRSGSLCCHAHPKLSTDAARWPPPRERGRTLSSGQRRMKSRRKPRQRRAPKPMLRELRITTSSSAAHPSILKPRCRVSALHSQAHQGSSSIPSSAALPRGLPGHSSSAPPEKSGCPEGGKARVAGSRVKKNMQGTRNTATILGFIVIKKPLWRSLEPAAC